MKRTLRTGLRYFQGMVLFSIVFQIQAAINDMQVLPPPLNITLVSEDARAVLRISCMGGNSLFISIAVPSGSFKAGNIGVLGAGSKDTRWLTESRVGKSVNIAYAARPRSMVRGLISRQNRRLFFTNDAGRGYAFLLKGVQSWLQALPAACR